MKTQTLEKSKAAQMYYGGRLFGYIQFYLKNKHLNKIEKKDRHGNLINSPARCTKSLIMSIFLRDHFDFYPKNEAIDLLNSIFEANENELEKAYELAYL